MSFSIKPNDALDITGFGAIVGLAEAPFTLQLLHFADAEAGLLASQTAPNLAALVDAFEEDFVNTLILAGGDNYIPGPFLAAGTDASVAATHNKGNNPGAADIEILNRIGVEASTVGNHEFDLGTNAFSDIVNDAAFPYLSANLDFSGDGGISGRYLDTVGVGGLEDAATLARRIVPSAVVNEGGEVIGLVGATTQIIETISSTGNVEVKGFAGDGNEANDMALLAGQLQLVIDDLRDQGVNKIILMAHLQQIALEQALAPLLEGVDIILAAGSNTRLGDADDVAVAFPGHAADFANDYPILTQGADGGSTLIVNTDNEYTYLGRLVVSFDADGNILTDSLDVALNGAYAATTANVAAAWGVNEADLATTAFAAGTKGAAVQEITDAVQAVIDAKDGELWGFTNVYLEGERNLVRNQETNLGNITADANLLAAQAALGEGFLVGSLKNAGGIRAPIGAVAVGTGEKEPPLANPGAGKPTGAVSTLDIENSLRFNNLLMVFDTDAAGLKAILEHGVAVLGNQGRYPQIGGISFSYDPDNAPGSRIASIAATDAEGRILARLVEGGAVSAEAPATISVVTLSFLANGGDGYPMKANGANFRFLLDDGTLSAPLDESLNFTAVANIPLNALGEQQAMKDFLAAKHATPAEAFGGVETQASGDTRIQDLNARADAVFNGYTLTGTTQSDTIEGTLGDDSILGFARDDVLAGFGGADTLDGGAGNDALEGGAGEDLLIGGPGLDTLDGGVGDDTMAGGLGSDLYIVDSAGDVVMEVASGGRDTVMSSLESYALPDLVEALVLGEGAVSGIGNNRANLLVGNALGNTLEGGLGGDTLLSGDGDDLLIGGIGFDVLEGGAGEDTLVGGRQADTLIGGEGNDVFRFLSERDSGATGIDLIDGFVRGEDKIELAFDANRLLPGIQDFAFTTLPFIPFSAGLLRVELVAPDTVMLLGNTDADAEAEFALLVRGVTTLDASDFI